MLSLGNRFDWIDDLVLKPVKDYWLWFFLIVPYLRAIFEENQCGISLNIILNANLSLLLDIDLCQCD